MSNYIDSGMQCVQCIGYTVYSRIQSALVFADFLKEKKLVLGSNPHLFFNHPLPTRQTDSVMGHDVESDE